MDETTLGSVPRVEKSCHAASMATFGRRRFLRGIGVGVALAAAGLPACRKPPTREEVLDSLVRQVVAPEVDDLGRASADLARQAAKLRDSASAADLVLTRGAWKRTALAWKRACVFRMGPLVDTE